MSVEKLFNTGFTSRSFQWNRVLKLYFFFPPSTINHSRLISSCNLRLFLISYSTKSLHCNKPFPSSLFQRESKCETLIVISSNFNMNDQGYSQQRLRNQTLLKKEAELNSEMACASSVAGVAQGGEPSQLQTRMKQRVASILLSNITYPILFLQTPVSKAKQI